MSDKKEPAKKKPYRKPRLVKFGSLGKITQGGGGGKGGSKTDNPSMSHTRV